MKTTNVFAFLVSCACFVKCQETTPTSATVASEEKKSRYYHRFSPNHNQPNDDDVENSTALRDFLNSYVEKFHKQTEEKKNADEKSKQSWDLLNLQRHKHPFEDKNGWVSLDPVPWSVSKVAKWKSNVRTTEKPFSYYDNDRWDDYDRLPSHNRPSSSSRPQFDRYSYNKPSENTPNKFEIYRGTSHPLYIESNRPNAHENDYNDYQNQHHQQNYDQHKHCNHKKYDSLLITDGMPSNFPVDINRRVSSAIAPDHQQDPHPFIGDGEWVLLSTTKGYKRPKPRQRSLDIKPESLGATKSVRLTVLPPLKSSKVNMTTSHGGLLQVESTFETVEQAKKKLDKKQRLKDRKKKLALKKRLNKNAYETEIVEEVVAPTIATVPRSSNGDPRAVLAAVGAGMLPATMAMLMPVALNGKRRKRDVRFVTNSPLRGIELTLPRNMY